MGVDSNWSFLFIHQGHELYGSDRSFILTVKSLKRALKNAMITVIIPKKGPIYSYLKEEADEVIIRDIGVIAKKEIFRFTGLGGIMCAIFRLPSNLKFMKRYDVVYINTIVVFDFIFASFYSRVKTIIHVREIPKGFSRLIFSLLLAFSRARLIFNSFATRDSYMFTQQKKCTVIYNAVKGFTDVEPVNLARNDIVNIIFIGRLNSWKGQYLLLHAINKLDEIRKKRIRVRLVGDVPESQTFYRDQIFDYIKKYDLSYTVEVFGFTEDPKNHYEWSHVVVVPSLKPEPFGLVAIEAMSAARAVIAADHGGLREIIIDNVTGFLFKPESAWALASCFVKMLDEPELLHKFGIEGRKRFHEIFTENTYEKNISDYFTSFLAT